MDEEEKRRLEEEKAKHEKTRRILKIVGIVLVCCGLVLDIIFFVDMISSMSGYSTPRLFACGMIGLPMTGIGLMLLVWGSQREINRYMKNEMTPVVNDAAVELKPAVKAVAEAVKEVKEDNEAKEDKGSTTVCPVCGKENQPQNNFCDGCGARLYRVCPKCGARQDADDAFCGNCGTKLED